MEDFEYVIHREYFYDERYRLVQCAHLAVRKIQLAESGGMTRGQMNTCSALNLDTHLYLRRTFAI